LNFFRLPQPVWAAGCTLDQPLHIVAIAIFGLMNLKTSLVYIAADSCKWIYTQESFKNLHGEKLPHQTGIP
jgi:hypothetical protein